MAGCAHHLTTTYELQVGDILFRFGLDGVFSQDDLRDFTRAAESALDAAEDAASDEEARSHYEQAASASQAARCSVLSMSEPIDP